MLADSKIPIRMADPRNIEIFLKAKSRLQIGTSNQLIENHSIVNSLDLDFFSVAVVKQLSAPLYYFGNANGSDAEKRFGRGEVDSCLLLFGSESPTMVRRSKAMYPSSSMPRKAEVQSRGIAG